MSVTLHLSDDSLSQHERENKILQQRVEELTDFIENASIPLHWVDGEGTITWANQAELDLLGYTKEEYIGAKISDFHAERNIIDDILTRLINNETLVNYQATLRCKDGSVKYVLINSNVLRKNGKFLHTRCFTRDITDLKKEEEKKNKFIAMVSHELKTPLTSIKSYIQVLLSKALKEGDEFRSRILTRTDAQIKKMTNMVADFLTLSRLEEARINLHKEIFNINSLCKEIISDAKIISPHHHIILKESDNIKIFADREKIGQVLTNLLSNAIKYSSPDNTITIGCERTNDEVKIYVRDTGMGIATTDQLKLFNPFYRVENELTKSISGFGMGLYLVSELLRYHGSQVMLDSKEGVGSTFYFYMQALQKVTFKDSRNTI